MIGCGGASGSISARQLNVTAPAGDVATARVPSTPEAVEHVEPRSASTDAGPAGPAGPIGPRAPSGPRTFHWSGVSLLPHTPFDGTRRTPVERLRHAFTTSSARTASSAAPAAPAARPTAAVPTAAARSKPTLLAHI